MAKVSNVSLDNYIQRFAQSCSCPVTTPSVSKMASNRTIRDRYAMVIHQLQYDIKTAIASVFDTAADAIHFGLTFKSSMSAGEAIDPNTQGIIDYNKIARVDLGTAASGFLTRPIVKHFENLPGGGLICHPSSLYTWGLGENVGTTADVKCTMLYTITEISEDVWRELWELLMANTTLA